MLLSHIVNSGGKNERSWDDSGGFLTAFKTLSRKEQGIFFAEIIKNKRLREDLVDIAIAESRKKHKSRPFRKFIKEHTG